MYKPSPTQRLFLFNLIHRDFVDGNTSITTLTTRKIAVRKYVFLMFFIALPLVITITVLIALAGYRIELLLITEILTALIASAYFILRQYLKDRVLRHQGDLVYGEIIRQEIIPRYSGLGANVVTRIFYRFSTPDSERIIRWVEFNNMTNHLPDGRKYPEVGTPIVILYANDSNHKLL